MARQSHGNGADSLLETTFLVPNLHCPTCVSRISSLMDDFEPAPTIKNISIINHTVTVAHSDTLSVASLGDTLESGGYEVFDVILDPKSGEDLLMHHRASAFLEEAVERWDPKRRSRVDVSVRDLHDANCKMCADHHGGKDYGASTLESVATSDGSEKRALYLAVLSVDGMTCSSCVRNVTEALQRVDGVERADVSLIGHSANIHFRADDTESVTKALTTALDDAGYDAELSELKPLSESKAKANPDNRSDNWEATYSIDGMTCSSCVANITNVAQALEFVRQADVNLISHSAVVVFQGRDKEPSVRGAIEDAGYDATLVHVKPVAQSKPVTARTASLRIEGMHCPQCPKRIVEAARELHVDVQKAPTLDWPILTIEYIPNSPALTIRRILDDLSRLDPSFTISIHKPISIEERSREMLRREQRAILLRAILAVVAAIPALVIGVVYMNLVSKQNSGYQYLMHSLHGVSRAEWANFIVATAVYFFAADHFHRRMLKEIWALWRPRSPVPIAKRLYRFGSMNILISLGTTIAYFSSLAELIVAASKPSSSHAMQSSRQSYFDSVVFLTMFLLLGRLTEAHMKAKSGDAVSALGKLRPTEASLVVQQGGEESPVVQRVNVDLIDTGDHVRITHGSSPPCDGTLLEESAQFDESALTGESRLVTKQQGDTIFSGTINKGPAITISVTGPAGASMLDSIIQIVREGQSKRAPMERVADLLTAYFVPVVVLIAVVTWMVWLALGLSGALPSDYLDNSDGGWPFWSLQFAIAVFVIACPCGLGLAAPTALFVGGGLAAGRGILVKGGGEAFQEASNLDVVVFDKTGTLTEGAEPKIVQHKVLADHSSYDSQTILGVLKGVEENSSHPLARAAVSFAVSEGAAAVSVSGTEEIPGKGLKASFQLAQNGQPVQHEALVGNEALLQDYGVTLPKDVADLLDCWKTEGFSVMLLACRAANKPWELGGIFAASDDLRPEAAEVICSLQARGVDVWMLSGDNSKTANAVGAQVGIAPDNIIAGVLPTQKAEKVKYLQQTLLPKRSGGFHHALYRERRRATIAMVGDGINDAPALAAADVGIAVASGSDVAIQSAAFVLVHSDLHAVLTLVNLSRAVFRRVILNFFWAAIYNMIALPVAAGVLYAIKTSAGSHVRLDPAWAALAMAMSSISVVSSSLLLRTKVPGIGFRG